MNGHSTAHRLATETSEVERVYAGLAGVYDGLFDWALRPGRLAAVRRLDMRRGARVLEVGVGTGLSLATYPRQAQVTGIDISEAMLERARRQAAGLAGRSISIERMDAQAMSFGDAAFDHVIAPYVISVVPDPERVMGEIRRVCKPGGTVIVVNHFMHEGRMLGAVERIGTPLTRHIGFRLDTRSDIVTRARGLAVQSVEEVNLLGMWKLVVLKRANAAAVPQQPARRRPDPRPEA